MGTGWRRAFCTSTLPRNSDVDASTDQHITTSPSPTSCTRKLSFFSNSHSNPNTPRLHCRTSPHPHPHPNPNPNPSDDDSPALRCKTATYKVSKSKSTRPLRASSECNSPRSPLKLSLFRSRSNCGVCGQSVKTGQGMAIYTAECGHAFHFPCIAENVRNEGKLACPVCNLCWKDVPLLSVQASAESVFQQDKAIVTETKVSTPKNVTGGKDASRKQQFHHGQLKPVVVLRAYDDDESLLTPTAGEKFNPIPEAEEEEDQVEEFQGFFVNPIPSCSVKPRLMTENSGNVDVKPMPEAAVLSVNQSYENYALALKVKAPSMTLQPDRSRLAPIDIVAVVDVSGSMEGAKLHMLKRAMRLVISSLGASDRLSIVAFSATTKRLLPLRRMGQQGKLSAKHIIDQLICSLGSNAGDAIKKAIKVLEDRRERNSASCIMLLSDGQDEQGHNHVNIHTLTRCPHIRIPVHAFSYGNITGNAADEAFAKGLGSLLSIVTPDLRIKLKLDIIGADIAAVYCNNFCPTLLGSDSIRLGDLYAGEERELLLEVRISRSASGTTRPLLTARCSFKPPSDKELINHTSLTFQLPKLQPIRSTAPKIERLRNLFIATRAIAEARGLVEQCKDYSNAHRLLMSARLLVLQSSTSEMTAGEYVRGLEMEMMELARRINQQQEVEKQRKQQRIKKQEWDLGLIDENGDPLTPTSAWRAAEMLAKVAMMKKSLNKVSDLHGFENARF